MYQTKHRNKSSLGKLIQYNRSTTESANKQVKTGQYQFFCTAATKKKKCIHSFYIYCTGIPFKFLRIGFFIVCIDIENFKAIYADIICKRSDPKIACCHSG